MMFFALALLPSALAVDAQSLRAEMTYDLFRDPIDFLLEPGRLAHQEHTSLYTLLAAQNEAGRMGLGAQSKFGNFALGALADGTRDNTSDSASSSDGNRENSSESWQDQNAWSILLGGGLSSGEKLSFGASLRLDRTAEDDSLDAANGSLGPNTTDTVDGDITRKTTGNRLLVDSVITGVLGASFGGERKWVEVDALLVRSASTSDISARLEDVDGGFTTTLDGFDPNNPLTTNYTALAPGLKVDSEYALNKFSALRFSGSAFFGSGSAAVSDYTSVTEYESGSDTRTLTTTVKNSDVKLRSLRGLVAWHYEDEENLRLRAGLGLAMLPTDLAWTLESTDSADTTTDPIAYNQTTSYDVFVVTLPVAVEIPASERWILRSGAQFTMTRTGTEDTSDYTVEMGGTSTTYTTSAGQEGVTSFLPYSVGFRFKASERFRLDAGLKGIAYCATGSCTGASGTTDATTFYASGVVHW